MRRGWFLACVCFVLPATPLAAQPKAVEVQWWGQSFFIVTSTKGVRVAFDPHTIPEYGRPEIGPKAEGRKADIVLISHNHDDHTQVSALDNHMDKNFKVIHGLKSPGIRADWAEVDTTIKDIRIRNVGVFHDNSQGLEKGKNSAFIVEMDGWKICHLGDLGHELTDEQLKKIGEVDVLMIPVGGVYALNGSEAKKVVEQIKPKEYIFPMHYGTDRFEDLLPITEFLDGQDKAKVTSSKDNKLSLNRDAQRPRPLIVQLHYWPQVKKN